MTVWQDQPPLSRRQVRESSPTDVDESAIADESDEGENPPRRSAGRRVQWDPSAEAPAAEPVHENPAEYRVRDYRPDIRRAAFAPLQAAAPQDPWAPPSDASGTIGVAERSALPTELAAPEYTMTRRALRELRQRAEAAGQEAPNVVRDANGALALTGSIPVIDLPRDDEGHIVDEEAPVDSAAPVQALPEPSSEEAVSEEAMSEEASVDAEAELDAAPAEQEFVHDRIAVEDIVAAQSLADSMIDEVTFSEAAIVEDSVAAEPDDLDDFDGDTLISAPAPIDEPTVFTIPALIEPDGPENLTPQRDSHTAVPGEPGPESLSPFDALFLPPSSGARPIDDVPPLLEHEGGRGVEPAPDAAPFGHWSTQGALDDASQSTESALSRNVGFTTGAITTHALVLPSAPSSRDHLLNPVTATGELMVTGSIDLPRSFGSTGAHPALFDHPDVDALIDESDREDAVSESAPVRAIRAVSSNSSTRGVIEAPAPRKSRLPLIAGITGGSALLVAAGVVAAGFIFNVF